MRNHGKVFRARSTGRSSDDCLSNSLLSKTAPTTKWSTHLDMIPVKCIDAHSAESRIPYREFSLTLTRMAPLISLRFILINIVIITVINTPRLSPVGLMLAAHSQ